MSEDELANGKPGDHPYTDIVVHGRDVYSPKAAALVREIAGIASKEERGKLADLLLREYNVFFNPDVQKLEGVLTQLRDKLMRKA
jgi:S-adenosylmethionine hydrolase